MATVEMRAAVHRRYGGPETLHEAKVATPVPSEGELPIRVSMASVNGSDTLVRSGALRLFRNRRFPKRTGLDFVGEVVMASAEAPRFEQGDRVAAVMPLSRIADAHRAFQAGGRHGKQIIRIGSIQRVMDRGPDPSLANLRYRP